MSTKEKKENPITALVTSGKTSLQHALANSPVNFDRFVVGLKHACAIPPSYEGQPTVMECVIHNPKSVMQRLLEAAQLGLSPAPSKQHFHLIPRRIKGELTCTSIIGFRGYLDLAMRSGQLQDVGAEIVYKDEVPKDGSPFFKERGVRAQPPSDPFREFDAKQFHGVYAWAKVKGRDQLACISLSAADVAKRRKKAQTDRIWSEWTREMILKTAIRALMNSGMVPQGELIERADDMQRVQDEEIRSIEATVIEDAPKPSDAEAMHGPQSKPAKKTKKKAAKKTVPKAFEFDETAPTVTIGPEWPSLGGETGSVNAGSYHIHSVSMQVGEFKDSKWQTSHRTQKQLVLECHTLALRLVVAQIVRLGLTDTEVRDLGREEMFADDWDGVVDDLDPGELVAFRTLLESKA